MKAEPQKIYLSYPSPSKSISMKVSRMLLLFDAILRVNDNVNDMII